MDPDAHWLIVGASLQRFLFLLFDCAFSPFSKTPSKQSRVKFWFDPGTHPLTFRYDSHLILDTWLSTVNWNTSYLPFVFSSLLRSWKTFHLLKSRSRSEEQAALPHWNTWWAESRWEVCLFVEDHRCEGRGSLVKHSEPDGSRKMRLNIPKLNLCFQTLLNCFYQMLNDQYDVTR